MTSFRKYSIDNGEGLKSFIDNSGLRIKSSSGLEGSQNSIIIQDFTSLNWKSNEHAVRINCKEEAMYVIEKYTTLKHFDNVKGDPTRPYSFFARNMADLIDVIYALKTIDDNNKLGV